MTARIRTFEDGTVNIYILVSECGRYVKFGRSIHDASRRAKSYRMYDSMASTGGIYGNTKWAVYHEWRDNPETEGYVLNKARGMAEQHPHNHEVFYMNPVLEQYIHTLKSVTSRESELSKVSLRELVITLMDRVNTLESKIDLLLSHVALGESIATTLEDLDDF